MKYVRAFPSIDAMRSLRSSLGCIDQLLSLEKEFGFLLEAEKIAKMGGDVLREADLFGKNGCYQKATMNILWYVLFHSLWPPGTGSKGWPLKQFAQKDELVAKAKYLAKPEPVAFYEYVCVESSILVGKQSCLAEVLANLSAAKKHGSIRGEILCARNILESHLHESILKFLTN